MAIPEPPPFLTIPTRFAAPADLEPSRLASRFSPSSYLPSISPPPFLSIFTKERDFYGQEEKPITQEKPKKKKKKFSGPLISGDWYYANFNPIIKVTLILVIIGSFLFPFTGLIAIIYLTLAKCRERSLYETDPQLKTAEENNVAAKDWAIASIIIGGLIYILILLYLILYYTSVIPTYQFDL